MKLILSLLLLAGKVQAQNITVTGPFSGLNNDNPSITIDNGESQDTLNAEVSRDSMSIKKRKGFSLYGALAVSTAPIYGAINFKTPNGNNIKMVAYDRFVDVSIDGKAFTHLVTTATIGAKWRFCETSGKVYGFNDANDIPIMYDGTTLSYKTSIPYASFCAMTVDRMLLAGTTTFPNRLFYSESGNVENYTIGVELGDPGFEDIGLAGDRITAIFATKSEWLVAKAHSLTSYQGSNQFDLLPDIVSSVIGINDPGAIVYHEGIVYFKSTDGKLYGYSSGTLTELSKKISAFVSGITTGEVIDNRTTNNAEWLKGTFVNTQIAGDSVINTTWTHTDTSSADWSNGSGSAGFIDTTTLPGSIKLEYENFSDLNYTANPIWTDSYSVFTATNGYLEAGPLATHSKPIYITNGQKTGTWEFKVYTGNANGGDFIFDMYFSTATTILYPNAYHLKYDYVSPTTGYTLFKSSANTYDTELCTISGTSPEVPNIWRNIIFTRYSTGAMTFSVDSKSCSATDSTINDNEYIVLSGYPGSRFDDFKFISKSTGIYTSAIYDTGFSTTIGGPFIFSETVPAGSTTSYAVRDSSYNAVAGMGAWNNVSTTTSGVYVTPLTKRYQQYKASLTTSYSTQTPSIQDITLNAGTTGYWEGPDIPVGPITSWGQLIATEDTQSTSTLHWTYQLKSSTYTAGLAGATYNTVVTNTDLTISTNTTDIQIKAINSFTSSSETVRLKDISVGYVYHTSTGATLQSAAFEYLGDIYFSVPYNYSNINNRLLKLDINSGGWNIFDIPMNSPILTENRVYFGNPSGGYVYEYPRGDSDNGIGINSYWKSKNYIGTNPYVEKQFQKISLIAGSDYGSNLDVTYTMDTTTSTAYTIDLTSSTAGFVRNNRYLPIGERGTFFNLQIGNNGLTPWSFYGANVEYTDDSWKVLPEN